MAAVAESIALPTCRLSASRAEGGVVSVTVATTDLLRVRRAIVMARIPHVGIMKATPLACGSKVRLMVAVPAEEMHALMDRIRRALRSPATR